MHASIGAAARRRASLVPVRRFWSKKMLVALPRPHQLVGSSPTDVHSMSLLLVPHNMLA